MSADHPILVLTEHEGGDFQPSAWEGLALARKIQAHHPGPIKLVILGDLPEQKAAELGCRTGEDILAFRTADSGEQHPEFYRRVLADLASTLAPNYLLLAHHIRNWGWAPRLARRLGLACVTAVTRVIYTENRLRFQKNIYGGKLNTQIEPDTNGAVLTFEPGYFSWDGSSSGRTGSLALQTVSVPSGPLEFLEELRGRETEEDLGNAEVVVAAGRGIGKEENLNLARRLADLFPRSALGGSRPLCDMGWLKYRQQVGSTGATVRPRLYLALGISGASQHIAGMKDSGFIVAVNRDSQAAIFNWSDLCIVEDLESFLPLLIETLSESR